MISNFILPHVKSVFNQMHNTTIYYIDSIPTIIYNVKGDIAKGAILSENDMTLTPCFIMKKGDVYAHAKTLHEAHKIVHDKFEKKYNVDDRINKFKNEFPDFNIKVKAKELFNWHYYLTGSCALGKIALLNDKHIDLENDMVSVHDFIELSRDKFGWDVIVKLL